MKMTEQQALELGKKVLEDIEFAYHKNRALQAKCRENADSLSHPEVKHAWSIGCE